MNTELKVKLTTQAEKVVNIQNLPLPINRNKKIKRWIGSDAKIWNQHNTTPFQRM